MASRWFRAPVFVLVLATLGSCQTPAVTVTAGRGGMFRTSITTIGEPLVVEGKAGRLFVRGADRGSVAHGDVVSVYVDGEVRVNGVVR